MHVVGTARCGAAPVVAAPPFVGAVRWGRVDREAVGARGCAVKVLPPASRRDKPPRVEEYTDRLCDADQGGLSTWSCWSCDQ